MVLQLIFLYTYKYFLFDVSYVLCRALEMFQCHILCYEKTQPISNSFCSVLKTHDADAVSHCLSGLLRFVNFTKPEKLLISFIHIEIR